MGAVLFFRPRPMTLMTRMTHVHSSAVLLFFEVVLHSVACYVRSVDDADHLVAI